MTTTSHPSGPAGTRLGSPRLRTAATLLLSLWTVACLFGSATPGWAASACGFPVRLDVLTLSNHLVKTGFPSLFPDPQNPTIYAQRSTSGAWSWTMNGHIQDPSNALDFYISDAQTKTLSETWAYTAAFVATPTNTARTGLITTNSSRPEGETSCRSARLEPPAPDGWTNGDCGFGYQTPGTNVLVTTSNLQATSFEYATTESWTYYRGDGSWTDHRTYTATLLNSISLAQPYSLATFLSDTNLPATWPDWTTAAAWGASCRGGQNVYRVLNATNAHFNATLSKIKYRIAYFGPKFEKGTIRWVERFVPMGGGPILTTNFSRDVVFTGERQYLDLTGGEGGKEVPWPGTNGQIEVFLADATRWGCSSASCQTPGSGELAVDSPLLRINLGRNAQGEPAGFLYWSQDFTSDYPRLFGNHGLEIVPEGDDLEQPRQIKTSSCLVDISIGTDGGGTINFYAGPFAQGGNGLYTSTNAPFAVWTLAVNPPRTSVVVTTSGGAGNTTRRFFMVSCGWALERSDLGTEFSTWAYDGTGLVTNRVSNRVPNGETNAQELRILRDFSFPESPLGYQIIERRVGSNAAPDITTWSYYNDPNDLTTYGKLKTVVYPNGSWERTEYTNGLPSKVTTPFLDSAFTDTNDSAHRVTLHSYAPLAGSGDDGSMATDQPRTTVQRVQNNEVARTYRVVRTNEIVEIQRVAPGPGWTTDDLFTTTQTLGVDGFDGVVERVFRSDGTLQISESATPLPGAYLTNTLSTGAPSTDGTTVAQGTRTVTILQPDGRVLSQTTTDLATLRTVDWQAYEYSDSPPNSSAITVHRLDGTSTSSTYDCCGLQSATDEDGVVTSYTYDPLRRLLTETRAGVTLSNVYDAAGNTVATWRFGSNGLGLRLSGAAFDLMGRQTAATNALGLTTCYSQNASGTLKTTTYPNGGTVIKSYALDGTLLLRTGTATRPVRCTNYLESDGGLNSLVSQEIKLTTNLTDSAEWTKTYTDMLGRQYKTVYPSNASSHAVWNNRGQLAQEVDADGVTTSYTYNALGEPAFTTLGTTRVTWVTNDVATNSEGAWVRRTRNLSRNDSGVFITHFTSETALTNTVSWQRQSGRVTTTTVERLGNGARRVTQLAPDNSRHVFLYSQGRLTTLTHLDPNGLQLSQSHFLYDPFGRQVGTLDARTGLTTNWLDNADQVLSVTTPGPNPGDPVQTTAFSRDSMGAVTNTLYPDATSIMNVYSVPGDLVRSSGSRAYPAGYRYDIHGRLLAMTNWTNFASGTGQRVTSWANDPQRGWLAAKRDALNYGTDYSYTPAGRLAQRRWARGTPRITTTYSTNAQGDVAGIAYNDGTASMSFAYDALGRQRTVTQGTTATTLTWDDDGHLLGEQYSGGPLSGLCVTNLYDALGRRTAVGLPTLSTNLTQYTYDAASRLRTVSNGLFSATYNYLANSPLVEQIDCRHQGHDRMMTGRTFDHLNRLTRVLAMSTNGALLSFAYGYNRAGQRTNAVLADGSYWQYQYDSLGQLTSAKRRWSDGAPVAAQQWEYLFDAIGNRTQTKAGGDPSGSALRPASYQVDAANQYTQRDVPRTNDVIGAAPAAATVVVNGVTNQNRHGEYFSTALGTNQDGAFWLPVTVTASQGATNETSTGHLFLPATPETFTHDLDGNLTGDGRWSYTWDAENRLLGMVTLSAATNAGAPRQTIAFTYDWQGRRIRKTVSNWIAGDWSLITDHRFLYDGWNLLALLDQTNGLVQSFIWGLDASGTMQGAGGVGGLLAMTVHTGPNAGTYFYCYDGNWNVVGLVNAANGALAARYEYGPFHELLRATGPLARQNPFLAATKYYDWETGLYYYGYRYYSPSTGGWLSRDPIGEMGGPNLYTFIGNRPILGVDTLGDQGFFFPATPSQNPPPYPPLPTQPGIREYQAAEEWLRQFWYEKTISIGGFRDRLAKLFLHRYIWGEGDYKLTVGEFLNEIKPNGSVYNPNKWSPNGYNERLKADLATKRGAFKGTYTFGIFDTGNWTGGIGRASMIADVTVCRDANGGWSLSGTAKLVDDAWDFDWTWRNLIREQYQKASGYGDSFLKGRIDLAGRETRTALGSLMPGKAFNVKLTESVSISEKSGDESATFAK